MSTGTRAAEDGDAGELQRQTGGTGAAPAAARHATTWTIGMRAEPAGHRRIAIVTRPATAA